MENLVFLLKLNTHLILEIEIGRSVYSGLLSYLKKPAGSTHPHDFIQWMAWYEANQNPDEEPFFENDTTDHYFQILHEGLSGQPILEQLQNIQGEIAELIELELHRQLNKLPYYLMMPLMLFIFPAFLVLIMGPILMEVLKMNI